MEPFLFYYNIPLRYTVLKLVIYYIHLGVNKNMRS